MFKSNIKSNPVYCISYKIQIRDIKSTITIPNLSKLLSSKLSLVSPPPQTISTPFFLLPLATKLAVSFIYFKVI